MVGFSSSRVLQVSTAPMPLLSPHLDAVTYNSKGIRRNSRHQQSIRRGKCHVLMTISMTEGQSNINKGSRKVILDVCYLHPHPTHSAALSVRLSNNNLDGCAFAQHCALPVLVVAMCRHRHRAAAVVKNRDSLAASSVTHAGYEPNLRFPDELH